MCTYEMSDSEWLQGYECHMKDDKTCGNGKLCGVQNPPESLGEKQCFVMASELCDAVPGVPDSCSELHYMLNYVTFSCRFL